MSRWTTTEIATLAREYARAVRIDDLRALLARHTHAGLYAKARKLGLTRARRKKAA
ncbi:MAG: hypothetical protein PW999_00640 [Paraburkholderia tropica]|nr:hypothetical protein [Paraburkholderia tropica]